MDTTEATKQASLIGGQVKIMEGIFEILDTKISYDPKVGSFEFNQALDKLEAFEAEIEKLVQKRDFLWSIAKS